MHELKKDQYWMKKLFVNNLFPHKYITEPFSVKYLELCTPMDRNGQSKNHSSLFDYHAEFARKAFPLCNTEKEMKLKIKGK